MSTGRRKKIVSKRKAKNFGNGMAVAIGILLGLLVMGGVGWYFWGSSASAPATSSQDALAPVATTSPSPMPDAVAPPALANLDFGPAPPTGMVLSQAMIRDMQKMIDRAAADNTCLAQLVVQLFVDIHDAHFYSPYTKRIRIIYSYGGLCKGYLHPGPGMQSIVASL